MDDILLDMVAVISVVVRKSHFYDDCRATVNFLVPDFSQSGGPPREIEIQYPVQDDRHLITLMRYTDGPATPVPHQMMQVLKNTLTPIVEKMK
jgi:hypothetical protein